MDYNYLNDQQPLSLHRLDDWSVRETLEKMPKPYNPFTKHYEETEIEGNRFYMIDGGPLVQQIPQKFGVLAHPHPENGNYYLRYDKGDDHGMARSEDKGEFESAKFNQRLNPHMNRVGNYSHEERQHTRTEDDMKAGSFALFPNVGGLVTSALYKASGVPFAQKEAEQNSLFFQVIWNNRDIRDLIVEKLFGHAEALSNFTRSCQRLRRDVNDLMGYFNTNNLDFGLCDRFPEDLESMIKRGKITQQDVDKIHVPKFLAVGPCRKAQAMAAGYTGDPAVFWPPQVQPEDAEEPLPYEHLFNERGFRMVGGYSHNQKELKYMKQCGIVQRSLVAFSEHRKNYNYLALVQIDFMCTKTIEAIVDSLVNLKCLCIYSCPLIDLSAVKDVIEIVGRTNEKRRADGKPLLDLDIAPQYRQGPIVDRMGSYGVTHSDPRIFNSWGTDIGKALAANLVSLLRAAKKAEIELCQPGKAFRRWLDRLPLAVNQTYNLCVAAANFVSNADTRETYAKEACPNAEDEHCREWLTQQFDLTVKIDLAIAAEASPVTRRFLRESSLTCTKCKERLPETLFRNTVRHRQATQMICEGCELHSQLRYELGNNHLEKCQIANYLWRNAPGDKPDLEWILGVSKTALHNNAQFLKATAQLKTPKACLAEVEVLNQERQEVIQQMHLIFDFRFKDDLKIQLENLDTAIEELRVRAGFQRKPMSGCETMYDWDYRRAAYHWRGMCERGDYVHGAPYDNISMLELEKTFNMRH